MPRHAPTMGACRGCHTEMVMKNSNEKTAREVIGALVGMGPASTSYFYNAVMNQARQQADARFDADFPEMVMISLPTPFVPGRPLNDATFIELLTSALRRIEAAGASFAAIPCNVVHRYMDAMQSSVAIDVLDMIALCARQVALKALRRPALLATQATADAGLYARACQEHDVELFCDPSLQHQVDALIGAVKQGREAPRLAQQWRELHLTLRSYDCDAAIVACTDLSPLAARWVGEDHLPCVDSSLVLATACVSRWHVAGGGHDNAG